MNPTIASPHGCARIGIEPAGAQGRGELPASMSAMTSLKVVPSSRCGCADDEAVQLRALLEQREVGVDAVADELTAAPARAR